MKREQVFYIFNPGDAAAVETAFTSSVDWEKVDVARAAYAEESRSFLKGCLA